MSASVALYRLGLDWSDVHAMRSALLWALRRTVDDLIARNEWDRP